MADTSVKFFHSGMSGHPALSGSAGALLAVLDACLVNGWGSGTADSVVIAGNIATVTRSAGHSFEVGSVALLAGATVTGGSINGEQKVLTTTATTYTFATTGISNQTATGTITHKVAPLGWSNTPVTAGTNVKAYKPSDVAATGMILRVDDTGTTDGRVVGYETMSDISTGVAPFPTTAQVSGGLYVPKSSVASAAERNWVLCGDGRLFYLFTEWNPTSYALRYGSALAFGDIVNVKTPDAYACMLFAPSGSVVSLLPGGSSQTSNELGYISVSSFAISCVTPRAYTGLGSSTPMARVAPLFYGTNGGFQSGAAGLAYPNPTDGGLYLAGVSLVEGAGVLRGQLPGFYHVGQTVGPSVFTTRDAVTGITGLAGKVLKAIKGDVGVVFLDTTGPWR